MTSTSKDRLKKIAQKSLMKPYLAELHMLLGREISQEDLCTLEQTEALRKASQKCIEQATTACEIDFSEKETDRFRSFIEKLSAANSLPIYLWTPRTIDCGTLMVTSLQDIAFSFDFDANEMGTLAIVTSDSCDKLLLDWFTSETNDQRLKLETQGTHWAHVRY